MAAVKANSDAILGTTAWGRGRAWSVELHLQDRAGEGNVPGGAGQPVSHHADGALTSRQRRKALPLKAIADRYIKIFEAGHCGQGCDYHACQQNYSALGDWRLA